MSADNMVVAFPYKTKRGVEGWVVTEVTLSGLPFETVWMFSQEATELQFRFFVGDDAEASAVSTARKWVRAIEVCEYGLSLGSTEDGFRTFDILKKEAIEGGYEHCKSMVEQDMTKLFVLPERWQIKATRADRG